MDATTTPYTLVPNKDLPPLPTRWLSALFIVRTEAKVPRLVACRTEIEFIELNASTYKLADAAYYQVLSAFEAPRCHVFFYEIPKHIERMSSALPALDLDQLSLYVIITPLPRPVSTVDAADLLDFCNKSSSPRHDLFLSLYMLT